MMKLTSYGIASAWLVFAGFNNLLATDRHVPADYATIQAAVNAAASGDTIHIAPGVYKEQTWIANMNLPSPAGREAFFVRFNLHVSGSSTAHRASLVV